MDPIPSQHRPQIAGGWGAEHLCRCPLLHLFQSQLHATLLHLLMEVPAEGVVAENSSAMMEEERTKQGIGNGEASREWTGAEEVPDLRW